MKPEGAQSEGVTVAQDSSVYAARLDPGVAVEHAFGPGRGGYYYLIQGRAEVSGERFSSGDAAYVLAEGRFLVRAERASELLLVDTPL